MKKQLIATVLMLPLLAVSGVGDIFTPSPTPAKGVWCSDFDKAKDFAEKNDIPLVMVWSMIYCGHCASLRNALGTSAGTVWAAQQNAVFCFVEGYDNPSDPIENFTGGVKGESDYQDFTPFIRFYWSGRGSRRMSSQLWPETGEFLTDPEALSALLTHFENEFASFVGGIDPTLPIGQGEDDDEGVSKIFFSMGNTENDRLEYIAGATSSVDIPLTRTNAVNTTQTVTLVVTGGSATHPVPLLSQSVVWYSGEVLKTIPCTITTRASTSNLSVTLKDASGTILETRTIYRLAAAPANSPKNPYWLGERTKDSLNWGEWTMDIGIVTNKVRTFNAGNPSKKAYTMMLVEGSTWCPDCAMAEANFFNNSAFKSWAAQNQVVFGVLDIPMNPQEREASPSLLRYDSYRTSDDYVTLRGTVSADETHRYQSGAGYLSRHGVSYADALAVSARNASLVGTTTLNGGWNRPERAEKVNANRTGAPILLLLRDDGTIAARWEAFSDIGPAAYSEGYLQRLNEMIAQIDEPMEEADDDRYTTPRKIAADEEVSGTVSAVDWADVYEITGAKPNSTMVFDITGGDGLIEASVVSVDGTEVAAVSGKAVAGLQLKAKIGTADAYYFKIAPKKSGKVFEDEAAFGYTKNGSTLCAYSVKTSCILGAGKIGFVRAVTNVVETCGEVVIAVSRTEGNVGAASVKVKLVGQGGENVGARAEKWMGDATVTWADGEDGVTNVTLTVVNDGERHGEQWLAFELDELSPSAGSECPTYGAIKSMKVNIYDAQTAETVIPLCVFREEVRTIPGYETGNKVEYSLSSGCLPEGLQIRCENGKLYACGLPGAKGDYSAVYAVTLNGQPAGDVRFDFTVVDYDFAGVVSSLQTTRTYANLPVIANDRVVGLLRITVPKDGTLTAKYMADGKFFSYSSEGWTTFDSKKGRLTAVLRQTTDSSKTITVALHEGGGDAEFKDPVTGDERTLELDPNPWPEESARPWAGQYTVQMPQKSVDDPARLAGTASMALRMTCENAVEAGSMLYVAYLPNGRTVYGCSTLIADGDDVADLPFYHVSDLGSAPYVFSGGLAIDKNAATVYANNPWNITAKWNPSWSVADGYARTVGFEVYGGFYDKDAITANFTNQLGAAKRDLFSFIAETGALDSGRYGAASGPVVVPAEMTETNMPQLVKGAANPQAVSLAFDAERGVVRGSFNIPFESGDVAVTYLGIALPGWQDCARCSRGGAAVERPWATGSCSFSDRLTAKGVFRNGCEIRLDTVAK